MSFNKSVSTKSIFSDYYQLIFYIFVICQWFNYNMYVRVAKENFSNLIIAKFVYITSFFCMINSYFYIKEFHITRFFQFTYTEQVSLRFFLVFTEQSYCTNSSSKQLYCTKLGFLFRETYMVDIGLLARVENWLFGFSFKSLAFWQKERFLSLVFFKKEQKPTQPFQPGQKKKRSKLSQTFSIAFLP